MHNTVESCQLVYCHLEMCPFATEQSRGMEEVCVALIHTPAVLAFLKSHAIAMNTAMKFAYKILR